jgi:hypothetical protein
VAQPLSTPFLHPLPAMSIHARLGLRTLSHIRLPPALPSCSCRRAIMYSTSHSAQPIHGPSQTPSSSTTDSFVISDQPPISKASPTSIPSDAASPQVAAKPPQPPRVERARPKIRAAKAAITMVSPVYLQTPSYTNYISSI